MINPSQMRAPKMVFSIFKDYGPEIEFNNTTLSEEQALALVMSGFTLVEMNKDYKGRLDGSKMPRMLGPIPVPDTTMKAIAIPFETKITSSEDERIAEAGYRDCVVFFIFEGSKLREVLDSYGIVEPYFSMIARSLNEEKSITPSNLKKVYERMVDMFTGRIPRIFKINNDNSVKEIIGKRLEHADAYLICDLERKNMYVLLYNSDIDIWRKREIEKVSSEVNSKMFRSALRRKFITDIGEISQILNLLNIEIAPV
ncbi:MAG: hypothetical protein K9W46_05895 [Candidatus Heimdallarchaeum endolithica]|uniref:Uncharacterized protein n=1 Tax=Candidatus Heimdallarchaeum endolithica TaxID=2876572 RepID=A0A9Y1FPR6_9ARCH|nr:MAG: hypothetical protein K9W46_05895 [Candidatus Heimdallarchaeum endolithica]